MEAIATLLALVGTLAMLVSFVSVLWPLKRLGLQTRKRSGLVLTLSSLVVLTAGALVPDKPPAQALDQTAPEPQVPVESTADESTDTPEEPAAPPVQEVELYEILMKWNSERDRFRDPDTFVFRDWTNKPIRLTGLVYETSLIPTIAPLGHIEQDRPTA